MTQTKVDSTIRLFSQQQVGLATFLGSPLAGSFLMALNYHRVGQKSKSIRCFIIGAIATTILTMFSYSIPKVGVWFPFAILFIVIKCYEKFQNSLYKQHLLDGGKQGSWWTSVGIGLLSLLVIIIGISLVVVILGK